jgi:hypothetical protein
MGMTENYLKLLYITKHNVNVNGQRYLRTRSQGFTIFSAPGVAAVRHINIMFGYI